MTRIFFDTEFTDLLPDADLISIGFVTESGDRSLYIELADWIPGKASDFVRERVVPLLDQPSEARMTTNECAVAVREWLLELGSGRELELVSDSSWDWRLLQRLLGYAIQTDNDRLPLVAGTGPVLRFRLHSTRTPDDERVFVEAANPWVAGREHHALVDAQGLRAGVLAIEARRAPHAE